MKSLVIILIIFTFNSYSQNITQNDASWQLTKFDDFNFYNSTDWYNTYPWGNANNGLEYNDPSNLIYQAGYLKIKCEKLNTPISYNGKNYQFKSGAIWSKQLYKYGYFEISAKLPIGFDYWPAFWLWGRGPDGICTTIPNDGYYNEIDVQELTETALTLGNRMGINYHWRNTSTCIQGSYGGFVPNGVPINVNVSNEHKYGLFWEPNKMSFYCDDILVYEIIDNTYTPKNPMAIALNFAIKSWGTLDPNTVYPANFEINYLKINQLKNSCSTVENICLFDKNTYNYAIKKSITISGCANVINTSDNVNLWATDFIILDQGTEIVSNTTGVFSINITDCQN